MICSVMMIVLVDLLGKRYELVNKPAIQLRNNLARGCNVWSRWTRQNNQVSEIFMNETIMTESESNLE